MFVFLFNLWIMADEMKIIWKQWMNGLELDFWTFSGFGIMDWVIAEYLSTKIERKRICESGVIRKKIVHIKSYRDFGYGSTEGVIEGREGEIGVNLNWDEDLPFKRDFKSLLFGNLESFGAVGGGFTDILDLIINGGDLKSIIGLADTLCQTIGGFLEQRAKDVPDYLEVIRGEVKAEKKSMGKLLGKEIEEIRFSKAEKVSDKIKAGTKWGGMAFVGILNAVDNYEEFGTIHSKRFWEETLLETALDVIGGTLVSAIVGGLLAAAGISAAGIAIAAVTVGVMWAADVVYGYAQEAKGKESKRVTEAISDWVLDTAKQ